MITKRLKLEPLGLKYLESTYLYAKDLENTEYMLHLPNDSLEDTRTFLAGAENEWKKEEPSFWEYAVLLDGVHIGAVSMYFNEDRTIGELGWIIRKDHWGKGFATEAAEAIIEKAVKNYSLKEIVATCDSENAASYHVMEKLGMVRQKETAKRKNKSAVKESIQLNYSYQVSGEENCLHETGSFPS